MRYMRALGNKFTSVKGKHNDARLDGARIFTLVECGEAYVRKSLSWLMRCWRVEAN